jgi:predicted O-linked N-acetylglucosamine transferase (SPINDLY family)
MSDFNAAKFVHQKGIHILIDLAGHTNHNRLAVFSYKPAPIQISWLGFPITTGLPEIDYILGDPHSLPSHFQNQFSEIIVQLPQIYLSFQPPKAFLNFGNSPSIQNGFITFGSFNNLSKINSKVIFTWANILNSLPHSKLLLKTRQLSNPLVKAEIYAKFATHGIDESRLILKGTIESEIEHMEEYNKVDIALDTFPYPGVTTSAEALWMGVPVISLKGNSFLSSTPNSLLKNLEICNLIASDTGDYVKKAIKLASNLDKLNQLRKTIRQNSLKSPLFNNVEFAKNFGITLHRIWEKHFKILQS